MRGWDGERRRGWERLRMWLVAIVSIMMIVTIPKAIMLFFVGISEVYMSVSSLGLMFVSISIGGMTVSISHIASITSSGRGTAQGTANTS